MKKSKCKFLVLKERTLKKRVTFDKKRRIKAARQVNIRGGKGAERGGRKRVGGLWYLT